MPTSSRFAIAVHALTLLARGGDEPLKSEAVARSVCTSPVVVRRIWCLLAEAGLIASRTGAAGGSRLARGASEITLLDVYRAVEPGAIFALHPNPPNRRCAVGRNIQGVLGSVLGEAQRRMEQSLAEVTIADVLRDVTASRH
jgi:Rrf2 family protein